MEHSGLVEAVCYAEDSVFHRADLVALSGVFSLVVESSSKLGQEETSKQQIHFGRLAEETHLQVVHVSDASVVGASSKTVSQASGFEEASLPFLPPRSAGRSRGTMHLHVSVSCIRDCLFALAHP